MVEHNEFFFLCNLGVLSVDGHIDVVAHPAHYPIVSLKLLFAPIELEGVSRIVCQRSGRLQVAHQLQECGALVAVYQVLQLAYQLDADALMIELPAFGQSDFDTPFDVLAILKLSTLFTMNTGAR